MEKYEPYTALQKTDHKEVSVYEPLKEPTQELYESLRQSGSFAHCWMWHSSKIMEQPIQNGFITAI